jgi:amino acid transporter
MSLSHEKREAGPDYESTDHASNVRSDVPQPERSGFIRSIGLLQATAINMTQMCGIGPFITIPIMVAALGGPQAVLGWIAGAILALADGLIWAELGAAMPGAGGTYLYLREAFQYRTGRLMPFLFIWTAILSIPLIMSTGVIGMVEYLGYLVPGMNWLEIHLISLIVVVIVVFALYRRIESIGMLSTILWIIMILSVGAVIIASLTHFNPGLAFSYPAGAFTLNGHFFVGLGAGLLVGIYDYLGYNTVAYMGGEIKNPGRVMPWSIILSILGMMLLYLAMNIGVMGVEPWQTVANASSVASLVLERTWGHGVAIVVTVMIVITAFASIFAGLLGGSRVPYNAARDRLFLPAFGRMHPRLHFPHIALLVMGAITAIGTFFDLSAVISMLLAVSVLVQSVAQVIALTVLRRRQPDLPRPYKEWLYPIPSLIALGGWLYVYFSSGRLPILLSLIWIAVGVITFLIWARIEHFWPFGNKEIREEFREQPAPVEEKIAA